MWRFCSFLLILLAASLYWPTSTPAQALRWEHSAGGAGSTYFYDSKPTPDGGYVAAGWIRADRGGDSADSTHGQPTDAWLVKFDAQGQRQWDRRFGAELDAYAWSVCLTSDGGYLLGCNSMSSGQTTTGVHDQSEPGRGFNDYWVIKLDAQGHKQWDRRFGSNDEDFLYRAIQTSDGGYLLLGSSWGGVSGDKTEPSRTPANQTGYDFWVVKISAQGSKEWDRTLGGAYDDNLYAAVQTADGGFLVAGSIQSPAGGDVSEPNLSADPYSSDYWLVKLNAQGVKQWDHRYGGNQSETAFAMRQAPDGSLLLAGQSYSDASGHVSEPNRGDADYWVLKLTAQGTKIWDHRFGSANWDLCYDILPAAGGGYLLLGCSEGGTTGDKSEPNRGPSSTDMWLVRLGADGTKLWDRTYGSAGGEYGQSLTRLTNGNLLAVGSTSISDAAGYSASGDRTQPITGLVVSGWTVRLDSAGTKLSDRATTALVDEVQHAVLQTRDGGVLAVGNGQSDQGYDRTNQFSGDANMFWLLKRDSLGVVQWDTTLMYSNRGEFRPATRELANGGLLISGTARLASPYGRATASSPPYGVDADLLAYELDARGREIWRQEWGGPGEDWLAEMLPITGGYVLGGTSRSGIGDHKTEASRGSADFWLLRLNAARNRVWDHRFGGAGLDSLVSVRQTADGGYLLAGSTTSPAGGDLTEPARGGADYWLVKVNSLGVLQWQHRYGGPGHDWLAAARPALDGGYLLLGTTTSAVGGDLTEAARGGRDLWVVKVNNQGLIEWQRRYGGSGQDYAATLELDPDGGFVIGASTSSPASGDITQASRGGTDYWLLRLGSTGGLLWQNRFGGSGEDLLTCLTTTRGYGYALGGTSNSPTGSGEHQQPNRSGYDYWTLLLGSRRVPAPLITSFSPGLGLPGTVVTITGTNFIGTGRVEFNGLAAPGFAVNAAGTSITVALPARASTGLITVWANGSGSSATPFVVPTDLVISSAQLVQGTYRNVTVTGPATGGAGVGTLSGPLTVLGSLIVQDGGSLLTACQPLAGSGSFTLAAGGTLGICHPAGLSASGATGAVQLTGTRSFSPDASYVYNGTQAQQTGDGLPAQVRNLTLQNSAGLTLSQAGAVAQVLRLTQGNFATSGRSFMLLSSAAGTALVDNTGGVVLGTVTVQRFVSSTLNPGPGYRHFSAPISTATVASLATPGFTPVVNPAYNASATPGLVTPFPTVYGYEQGRLPASPATGYAPFERGWESPAQLTDALAVGRGYTVQLPAGLTVQFSGPLNNGPLPVTLNRATATPALTAETGWHLVGNPYPSPLDWRLLPRPATVDDACYVFQSSGPYTGQYRAYVNGFGPAPLVGSGQGFFVRVNTPGATPTLSFSNAARLTSFGQEPALQRNAADPRPRLRLAVASATGATDTTIVYFEVGATAGPDAHYDADKLANPSGLSLATLAGSRLLAIDGRPVLGTQPLTIPLHVSVPRPGTYTFTATELAQFAPGTRVYLLDALTGTRQLLAAGTAYPAALATPTAPGRFALEFRPAAPTATAAQALAEQVQLWPNPAHAAVWLSTPPLGHWQVATITDALGREVGRAEPTSAATLALPVAALPRGVYLVCLQGPGGRVVRRLILE